MSLIQEIVGDWKAQQIRAALMSPWEDQRETPENLTLLSTPTFLCGHPLQPSWWCAGCGKPCCPVCAEDEGRIAQDGPYDVICCSLNCAQIIGGDPDTEPCEGCRSTRCECDLVHDQRGEL